MKVLLVSDFYPPAVGGLEYHVHDLALALHRRGYDVLVATSASTEPNDDVVQVLRLSHALDNFGFLYSERNRRFFPPWPDYRLRARLRNVIKKFGVDLVHSHGWVSFNSIAAGRGSLRSVPVVVTLHDYGFVCPKRSLLKKGGEICLKRRADLGCIPCANETYGPVKSFAISAAMRKFAGIFKDASALIAISRYVARVAEESGLSGIQVIPSFIDVENVRNRAQANASKFAPLDIFYSGGGQPWKGVQILADSMRIIKERGFSLTLNVGDVTNIVRGAFLPRGDYLGMLAKSRIVVIPSIWAEPLSLTAVEGMALGKPVIASDIGGLPEIIENERSGLLIPAGNAEALAESILRLANDPTLCEQFGARGRDLADGKFGELNTLRPLEETYARLVQ
jgi:glycosyltransferase involved in cell wall biosynthesis